VLRRGASGYLTSEDGSDYETASEEGGGGGSVNGGSPPTPEGHRSLSPSPSPSRPQRSRSLNSSSKCVCSSAAQAGPLHSLNKELTTVQAHDLMLWQLQQLNDPKPRL